MARPMRLPCLALLLIGLLVSGCARPGNSVETPLETSIASVRADPARYHGKYLRLSGFIDICERLSCSISQNYPGAVAEDTKTPTSLSIDFEIEPGGPDAADDDGFRDYSRPLMDELYRFADVTVIGYYNATCDLGYDPDHPPARPKSPRPGDLESIVVCTDRAGSFRIHRILSVRRRWPATVVPLTDRPADWSLTALPAADGDAILAAYKAATTEFNSHGTADWNPDHRAFRAKADGETSDFLCVCRKDKCDGQWPASIDHLQSAPANTYVCVQTSRVVNSWRFPPASFE